MARIAPGMKRYGKVDQNEAALIEVFRAHGCHVHRCADFGGGFPDLLIGWSGTDRVALVEAKVPKGRLTEAQIAFHAIWPVFTVRDQAQAIEVITWLKQGRG